MHHAFVAAGSRLASSVWEMNPGRILRAGIVAGFLAGVFLRVAVFLVDFLVAMGTDLSDMGHGRTRAAP